MAEQLIKVKLNRTGAISEVTPQQWKEFLDRGWKNRFTIIANAHLVNTVNKPDYVPDEVKRMREKKVTN